MLKLVRWYFSVKLFWRISFGFAAGILCAMLCLWIDRNFCADFSGKAISVLTPFGTILISMLKMVVIPIIFFSLIAGASSLPVRKFGTLGLSVIVWYFLTSVLAGVFGTILAFFCNPDMNMPENLSSEVAAQTQNLQSAKTSSGFSDMLNGLFMNPFEALAAGNFLAIIVFAILFGLAARCVLDRSTDPERNRMIRQMLGTVDAVQHTCFKMIDWVMEYFPLGVFALIAVNSMAYGMDLIAPYIRIIGSVVAGILLMIFLIYPLLLLIFCRENPYRIINRIKAAIITAFFTRSSAAALPVSFSVAKNELHVREELSSFSLPLGATINMDGVCIHLPVFAILAVNLFDLNLGFSQMLVLLFSVILASVGAGGIPGGSVFLLFMVLANLGLTDQQVATVVALAIGINPLLDMFETACNVTGDNVCNYIIAKRNGMISPPSDQPEN